MTSSLKLVSGTDTLVVTLAEAKRHMRRTDTGEDDESILTYLKAATSYVENWTGLSLIDKTYDYFTDQFPAAVNGFQQPLYLPRSPLLEVLSVTYRDSTLAEVGFTDYLADYGARPGRMYLVSSGSWPSTDFSPNAVRVRFRAGFVDEDGSPALSDEAVPEDIKVAILMYAATMFECRENQVTGTIASKLPWAAEELLRQHRVETSIA
jgi:uncharacterized phiE125 gp8 family phage protein